MRRIVPVLLFFGLFSSVSLGHWLPADGQPGPSAPGVATPLNLNKATVEQLDGLPEVGPALAGRIVAYRDQHGPFTRFEQLDEVKGIGTRTLEKLRPHLALE